MGPGGRVEEPSEGSVRVGGALECRLDAAGGEVAELLRSFLKEEAQ